MKTKLTLGIGCGLLLMVICGSIPAQAEPYWIAWEGDDFPENEGWERVWGNWDGQYEGPGAIRTLEDGILTYDSLYDDGVYDFSLMYRPGQLDPGPGELFVMEWRLKVEQVDSWYADPGVTLSSDERWIVGLRFAYDRIYSVFEEYLEIPFSPGVFHEYRAASGDMREYDLYIDDELSHHGTFLETFAFPASRVTWGEGVQGVASLHHWDYFRFAVVPEPSSLALLSLLSACCGRRRVPVHRLSMEE
ncbi:MAG: PEP-CTERM sorting domain-containing protein [Planctomycetota bacterium]